MENALALHIPTADPYAPRNLDEVYALAKVYADSKIVGDKLIGYQSVALVMATGHEMGISPTASLRGLYVVEGRVFMSADLMVALCLRAPQCEQFELSEQSDTAAAYTVARKGGKPLTFRFTLDDAKRALLGGAASNKGEFKVDSNWSKYPGTMCRHRAAAIAARAVFPDVIMGLYEESERDEVRAVASVSPLPASTAPVAVPVAVPVDAEFTESAPVESDEARIARQLNTAATAAEVNSIAVDALKLWPKTRPDSVSTAHKAAKARTAAPVAPSELFAAREPGQEG